MTDSPAAPRRKFTEEADQRARDFAERLAVAVPELEGVEVVFHWAPDSDSDMRAYMHTHETHNVAFHLRAAETRLRLLKRSVEDLTGVLIALTRQFETLDARYKSFRQQNPDAADGA